MYTLNELVEHKRALELLIQEGIDVDFNRQEVKDIQQMIKQGEYLKYANHPLDYTTS